MPDRVHYLKTWPEPFEAMRAGRKTFELRKNDRGFAVGDMLDLQEWEPGPMRYTGRSILVRVTYILHGGRFGLPEELCVMGVMFEQPAAAERGPLCICGHARDRHSNICLGRDQHTNCEGACRRYEPPAAAAERDPR